MANIHSHTRKHSAIHRGAQRAFPYFGILAVAISVLASAQSLSHAAEESSWHRIIIYSALGAILGIVISRLTHSKNVCDQDGLHPKGNIALAVTLLAGGVHVFSDALVLHASPSMAALWAAIIAIASHEVIRTSAVGGVLSNLLNISLIKGIAVSLSFTATVLFLGLLTGGWIISYYPEAVVLPLSIGYFITSLISLTWHRLSHEMHTLDDAMHHAAK